MTVGYNYGLISSLVLRSPSAVNETLKSENFFTVTVPCLSNLRGAAAGEKGGGGRSWKEGGSKNRRRNMLIIIIICYLTRAPGQVPESLVRLRVCTILTSALLGVLITSLYGSSLNACLAPLLSPTTPLHHVLTRHASLAGAKTGSAAQRKLQSDEATSDGLQQSSVATFRPLSKSP